MNVQNNFYTPKPSPNTTQLFNSINTSLINPKNYQSVQQNNSISGEHVSERKYLKKNEENFFHRNLHLSSSYSLGLLNNNKRKPINKNNTSIFNPNNITKPGSIIQYETRTGDEKAKSFMQPATTSTNSGQKVELLQKSIDLPKSSKKSRPYALVENKVQRNTGRPAKKERKRRDNLNFANLKKVVQKREKPKAEANAVQKRSIKVHSGPWNANSLTKETPEALSEKLSVILSADRIQFQKVDSLTFIPPLTSNRAANLLCTARKIACYLTSRSRRSGR